MKIPKLKFNFFKNKNPVVHNWIGAFERLNSKHSIKETVYRCRDCGEYKTVESKVPDVSRDQEIAPKNGENNTPEHDCKGDKCDTCFKHHGERGV